MEKKTRVGIYRVGDPLQARTIRISTDTLKRIGDVAKRRRQSETQVIREALEEAFASSAKAS